MITLCFTIGPGAGAPKTRVCARISVCDLLAIWDFLPHECVDTPRGALAQGEMNTLGVNNTRK